MKVYQMTLVKWLEGGKKKKNGAKFEHKFKIFVGLGPFCKPSNFGRPRSNAAWLKMYPELYFF